MSEPTYDVAHLGRVELLTPDLPASLGFFVDVLGMEEVERAGDSVYLRAWGDYEHASAPADRRGPPGSRDDRVAHVQRLRARAAGDRPGGVRPRGEGWSPGDAGHGRSYRFSDPDGHRMTVYFESRYHEPAADQVPTLKNQPQRMSTRGVGVRRLDHVNVWCRDIDVNSAYMVETLGFRVSEQVVGDDGRLVGSWLHVTPKSYDLAYGRVDPAGVGGRLHHVAFAVDAREYVMRAADVFLDAGVRDRVRPREARGPADVLPLRVRAGRQPHRGDHRRPPAAGARLAGRHVDDGGAAARPGVGDADARELVHVRDATRRDTAMSHVAHEPRRTGWHPRNLQEIVDRDEPRRAAAQLADRRVRLPRRRRRVHELAAGAARLARDGRALRPDAPHGQSLLRGSRRA